MPQIRTPVRWNLPSHLYIPSSSPLGPTLHSPGQGGNSVPLHSQGRKKQPEERKLGPPVLWIIQSPHVLRPRNGPTTKCSMIPSQGADDIHTYQLLNFCSKKRQETEKEWEGEIWSPSGSISDYKGSKGVPAVAQRVKDPLLSLEGWGFNPWPCSVG